MLSPRFATFLLVPILTLLAACGESLTTEELLARGRVSLDEGKFNAASIDAKAALQQTPRSAAGRELLGDIAMARAAFADAAAEYEKALSFERDPSLVADYAVALIEAGKYRDILDEGLDGRFAGLESNAIVLAALANAEGATGNSAKASELIDRALRNTADDPFVRLVEARHLASIEGDVELARERAESLTADYPEYAAGFSALAAIASVQGDQEAAAAAYAEAARINPLRLRDRLPLVAALMSTGDLDGARAEVAALDKLIPTNPIVNFYQGRLALADGDIETGLAEMDEVLGDLPDHPGALYFAGLANLEEGNFATAERQLGNFLRGNPEHLEARLALGRLYLENSEGERAQEMANKVLTTNPGNVAAVRILAAALGLQGMYAESAQVYEQLAAAAEPDDVTTLVQYGSTLIRAGDEAGIPQLEKARDLDPDNEQARRLLVASYLAKGDVTAARSEAEAYRAAAPESAVPLVLLGQVALWEGDDDAASAAYDQALAIDSTSSEAMRGKAGLAMRGGDSAAAQEVFETALKEQPDSLESLISLAAIQEQRGETEAMAATLEKAVQSNPDALAPRVVLARHRMREGKYGQGVSLLTAVRDKYPESPDVHELLAGGFLAMGEMESAAASAEKLLQLRPDSPRALRIMAVTEQANKNFTKAEKHIQRALEIEPDDAQSRRTLVELYVLQQKYDELAALLAAYPPEILEKRDVKLARGRVELLRGNVDSAIDLLTQAQEMGGDSASVSLLVSALLRDGQTSEAESVADQWLEENPDDGAVLQQYSTYLLATARDRRGAQMLERLYQLAPGNIVVLNNLAWAYRSSNPERALELVDQALEQVPDNMSIIDTRSVILYEKGDYEEALEASDDALAIAPGFPQLLFHRGQILAGMGRVDEAISVLSKVERADFAEKPQVEQLLAELRSRP